jgi:transposase
MRIVYDHVGGMDVHKKTVVVTTSVKQADGSYHTERRTFGTMTSELLALSDWLMGNGITHVAMESTGEYWKPIFNILEENFTVVLVNAQHLSRVPGRKTDQSDADWICELMQYGLLNASFIPPKGQRELRELVRYRTSFVRERATLVNRVQKVLEGANIKLASVVTDILGVSGRAMLEAIVAGSATNEEMAELARGSLRGKRDELAKALEGRVKSHHRFVLTELLCQIDSLEESITRFDLEIEAISRPFEEAIVLLDTIPGVARQTAEVIVAEIGIDMSRFPTADHLASWAGVAPGNNESGGKRRSGKTRKGNQHLRTALVQAANAAARTRGTYLRAQYQRLAPRRGHKRAIMALAHSILVIAYHLIARSQPYRELGGDYFDTISPAKTAKRLIKRLEHLGFQVSIQETPAAI